MTPHLFSFHHDIDFCRLLIATPLAPATGKQTVITKAQSLLVTLALRLYSSESHGLSSVVILIHNYSEHRLESDSPRHSPARR
jgi:hypothetical protein